MKRFFAVLTVTLMAAACAGGAAPTSSGSPRSETDVRLRVLDALHGAVSFCGPPVAIAPTPATIRDEFRSFKRQRALYRAVLAHEGFKGGHLSTAEMQRALEVFHQIESIRLRRAGDTYAFTAYTSGGAYDHLVSGSVDASGGVTVQHRTIGRQNCPICLARSVVIATPRGPVSVTRIHDGMIVWSTDRHGHRIRATVLRTRHRRASGELLRITLADGHSVAVSPGHPTANGEAVGSLGVGDRLAGSSITSIAWVSYDGVTYDLLPSGSTHTYFADGVLLGTTLLSG